MTRWANGAEGIVDLPQHHCIERRQCPAEPGRRHVQRLVGNESVRVELPYALRRAGMAQLAKIFSVMHQFGQHQVAEWRIAADQPIETRFGQCRLHRDDALGAFGMTIGRTVVGKIGLADEKRGHGGPASASLCVLTRRGGIVKQPP